jgi:hypothetical protein
LNDERIKGAQHSCLAALIAEHREAPAGFVHAAPAVSGLRELAGRATRVALDLPAGVLADPLGDLGLRLHQALHRRQRFGRIDQADILAFGRIVDEADSCEKFNHGGTRCEPALQAGVETGAISLCVSCLNS